MSVTERWRGLARPSRLIAAGLVMLGAAGIALAADAAVSEGKVRALLKERLPKTAIGSVDCATIGSLCEIVAGDNLFYVDAGARYLVIGRVYDMETRQDITAARLLEMNPDMLVGAAARANSVGGADELPGRRSAAVPGSTERQPAAGEGRSLSLTALPKDGAIIWGNPTGETVTVFTDFRCGYCRALAQVLRDMKVRVVERPISVLGSRDIADRVYCAKDREAALHAVYAGETLKPAPACNTSGLDANEAFAARNALRGTPVIVRRDGAMLEGYRPREFLEQWLTGAKS